MTEKVHAMEVPARISALAVTTITATVIVNLPPASLKVAREELSKAIAVIERTKWATMD